MINRFFHFFGYGENRKSCKLVKPAKGFCYGVDPISAWRRRPIASHGSAIAVVER